MESSDIAVIQFANKRREDFKVSRNAQLTEADAFLKAVKLIPAALLKGVTPLPSYNVRELFEETLKDYPNEERMQQEIDTYNKFVEEVTEIRNRYVKKAEGLMKS